MNQDDFDKFLADDFQEQLQDNPPIAGLFSPEDELARIKNLPREQKREALPIFEEKLMRQRKALAACRVFIERSIAHDHDVSRGRLVDLIEKFTAQYGFTQQQQQIVEKMIDGYYETRQRALEIRRRFPDDPELVRALTGVNFGQDEKELIVVLLSFRNRFLHPATKALFRNAAGVVQDFSRMLCAPRSSPMN